MERYNIYYSGHQSSNTNLKEKSQTGGKLKVSLYRAILQQREQREQCAVDTWAMFRRLQLCTLTHDNGCEHVILKLEALAFSFLSQCVIGIAQ